MLFSSTVKHLGLSVHLVGLHRYTLIWTQWHTQKVFQDNHYLLPLILLLPSLNIYTVTPATFPRGLGPQVDSTLSLPSSSVHLPVLPPVSCISCKLLKPLESFSYVLLSSHMSLQFIFPTNKLSFTFISVHFVMFGPVPHPVNIKVHPVSVF